MTETLICGQRQSQSFSHVTIRNRTNHACWLTITERWMANYTVVREEGTHQQTYARPVIHLIFMWPRPSV